MGQILVDIAMAIAAAYLAYEAWLLYEDNADSFGVDDQATTSMIECSLSGQASFLSMMYLADRAFSFLAQ